MILAALPFLFLAYIYSGALLALCNRQTARMLESTIGAALTGWRNGGVRVIPIASVAPPAAIPCPPTAVPFVAPLASPLPVDPEAAARAILSSVSPAVADALGRLIVGEWIATTIDSLPAAALAPSSPVVSDAPPAPVTVLAPVDEPETAAEVIVSPAPSGEAETVSPAPVREWTAPEVETASRFQEAKEQGLSDSGARLCSVRQETANVYVRVNKKYRKANAAELTSMPNSELYAKLAGKAAPGKRQYVPLSELAPDADVA